MTATCPAPKRSRSRPRPPRSIGWIRPFRPDDEAALIRITVGKLTVAYLIREVPADCHYAGYELVKSCTGEVYHVALDLTGDRHSCECLGFLKWNHCKHVEGLLALRHAARKGA